MNAHTPGPWKLKHIHGNNFAVQRFEIRSETHLSYPIFQKDCSAIDGGTVCCSPEDARLIAAAPDLAASCGEMLILLIALGLANAPTAPQRLAEYPQVIALRAALDKAGL